MNIAFEPKLNIAAKALAIETGRAKVAVITRTKDRPVLLRRAIRSVLDQSLSDWVHVIVNDGGDPEAVDRVVLQFHDEYKGRLILAHNKTSVGMEAASNIGIRASDSDYIAIHDDDDAWHSSFLFELTAWHRKRSQMYPNVRGVACYSTVVVEKFEDDRVVEIERHPFNSWIKSITLWRMLASNCIPPISFLFEREAAEKLGFFDESLPVLGDWDFHIRFLLNYEISLVPAQLAYYHHRRAQSGAYTNTVTASDNKHELIRSRYVNEKLRREISEGRLGIATLINLADNLDALRGEVSHTRQDHIPRRLKKRLGRINIFLIGILALQIASLGVFGLQLIR
jgi:glycosyltransferase involved in cell wall biosynthesis